MIWTITKIAKQEDSGLIESLAKEIFYDVYYFEDKRGIDRYIKYEQSEEAIRKQMADGIQYQLIVDDYSDEVIGYVAYNCSGSTFEIDKLYLVSKARKQGFGNTIVREAENYARE